MFYIVKYNVCFTIIVFIYFKRDFLYKMKRPKAVVIEDDLHQRFLFKEALLENSLGFDVKTFSRIPDNLEELRDTTLFLIDYKLPGINGLEISRKLEKKKFLGAKIMITGYANKEMMRSSIKEQLWDGWLEKPVKLKELGSEIHNLKIKGKLTQKLNVGIIGLGSLGTELYLRSGRLPEVNTTHIFSNFSKNDYSSFLNSLEKSMLAVEKDFNIILEEDPGYFLDEINGLEKYHKVIAHKGDKGLETLARSNPDILFITTGEHNAFYSDREKLYESSIKKVEPIFKILRDTYYQGLVFLGSNPIGPLLKIGEYYGLDKYKLTGFSPDIERAKDLILGYIYSLGDNQVTSDDLKILGGLEHGKELLFLDHSLIGGEYLGDKYPIFNNPKVREEIINTLHRIGLEAMLASKALKKNYSGTPDTGERIIKDIAYFKECPEDFIYTYLDEDFIGGQSAFFGWPVEIDYRFSGIHRDPYFNITDLDKDIINQVRIQAEEQNKLFERVYLGKN